MSENNNNNIIQYYDVCCETCGCKDVIKLRVTSSEPTQTFSWVCNHCGANITVKVNNNLRVNG